MTMAQQHRIMVKNLSDRILPFYAFQKQPCFSGAGSDPDIFSNSIAAGILGPHASSGAQLLFGFDGQTFAAAVINASLSGTRQGALSPVVSANGTFNEAFAVQAVELAGADPARQAANSSTLSVSPLGLSPPTHEDSVPAGSFGIGIPSYSDEGLPQLFCGCAFVYQDEDVMLSSYVRPLPRSTLHCAPVPCFYVKVGSHAVGSPVAYDISQAACCDFTHGASKVAVSYNSDGTYTVTSDA